MLCPKCGKSMKNVMHFEKNKNYQFSQCNYCYNKTKNKRIHFSEDKNTILEK